MNNNPLFGIPNNNQGISEILNNNSSFDLVDIMCNNVLVQIKKEITIQLDQNEASVIDEEFKKSLKPIIAANLANNTQLSKEYIKELSYIYFALFNGTINVYYQIKNKNDEMYYYMLDKQFYNSIAENKIEWKKYGYLLKGIFGTAYNKGVLRELMSIFDKNINFELSYYDIEYLLKKDFFDQIMEFYGLDIIVKSNLHILEIGLKEENKEHARELIKINPNISFCNTYVFNTDVREVFTNNEIANFTPENLKNIEWVDTYASSKNISTYKKLLEINPNFTFTGSDFCELLADKRFDIPLEVVANLSEEEQQKMCVLYSESDSYVSPFNNSVLDASVEKIYKVNSKNKLKRLIKKKLKN